MKLRQGTVGLPELEAHAAQYRSSLRELNLVVLHDLDEISPGVEEIEAPARQNLDAGRLERPPCRLPVVYDQSEMAVVVRLLLPAAGESDELISHIDERHLMGASTQRELEDLPVEGERLVDVPHLDRDVVDPDKAWPRHAGHRSRQPHQ